MTANKSEKVFFRLHPAVAAQMKSRASAMNLTVSEFVRLAVMSACGVCIPCDPKGMKHAVRDDEDEQ